MSSFLLFPRSGSRLIPLFFVPVVIKVRGQEILSSFTSCRVGVNAEGTTELGKLERGSKGLMVLECPDNGVSLAVVGLSY